MTEEQLYNVYAMIEAIKIKVGTLHMKIEEKEMSDEEWDYWDKKFTEINSLLWQLENEIY